MKRVIVLLGLLSLASGALGAEGLPTLPVPVGEGASCQRTGAGQAAWLGFKLYDAALWTCGPEFSPETRYALALTYAREIAGRHLVDASMREIRRLGVYDDAQLARWQLELARIFPTVHAGDTIVGVNLPQQGAAFYYQGQLRGEVRDPAFARAFFDIWFDPRTQTPALRAALLKSVE